MGSWKSSLEVGAVHIVRPLITSGLYSYHSGLKHSLPALSIFPLKKIKVAANVLGKSYVLVPCFNVIIFGSCKMGYLFFLLSFIRLVFFASL